MRRLRRFLLVLLAVGIVVLLSLLSEVFGPGPGGGGEPEPPPPPAGPPPAGRIVGDGGGPAPADARVAALGSGGRVEGEVAEDGTFRFPEGTSATEYEVVAGSVRVRRAAEGGPVTIRLPGSLSVAGRVVDDATGEAVTGARVTCGESAADTDGRGRFRIEGVGLTDARLPPIVVRAGGYADLRVATDEPRAWDDLFLGLVPPGGGGSGD